MLISNQIIIVSLAIPSLSTLPTTNEYAKHISYEEFSKPQENNKNTLEYNTMTMEEMIRQQNQKIIDRSLEDSIKN